MKVRIACLQMASKPYDWDYNMEKASSMIKEAADNGADICLLPEVFIPGYSLTKKNFEHAESLDGPTINALLELAKKLNVHISGSIIEKTDKDFYNTMVLIGPNGLLGTYHKIYVFGSEQEFWKRGKNVSIIDTKFGSIGLGICADMHYAKLWKQYAGKVDLILICSAWPDVSKVKLTYAKHELDLCKSLPVKISSVLEVPTAYCNAAHKCLGTLPLVGTLKCAGFSKIVQNGKVVASFDSGDEGILYGDVEIADQRPTPEPSRFKNWIKYSYREKIPRDFMEKIVPIYSRMSYRRNKKKFLNK
ncbi:MAG: carbon-nitrogen hydrolase family protein [Candidatus Helarchaeota archaeon]